jgi:photosystem II stability/assembly factor-like uncharacterized protein
MAKAGLLFVGTDDGLVLFSNPNNVGRWLKIGQPFRGQAVHAVWPLADNPLVVFAAVEGEGLQRSDDGGQSWQASLGAAVVVVAGAASDPETLYAGARDEGVYRSTDAGASWAQCARGDWRGAGTPCLVVARAGAQVLYLGLSDGTVWTSPDGGASWLAFGAPLPAPVAGLAEAHGQPGLLYCVAGGELYRSDGQSAWQPVETSSRPLGPIAALAGKSPVLLLAAGEGIARSDDGGATWRAIVVDGEIAVIAPAPYHMDTAFAGGTSGTLLGSADRGRAWENVKGGLAPIRAIAAARLA